MILSYNIIYYCYLTIVIYLNLYLPIYIHRFISRYLYLFLYLYIYIQCRLRVRLPHHEDTKIIEFFDDDTYFNEDVVFLEAVLTSLALRDDPENFELQETAKQLFQRIQSPYSDAINTYKFTWKIRTKSEEER